MSKRIESLSYDEIEELSTKLKEIIFDYSPQEITLQKSYEILELLRFSIIEGKGILDYSECNHDDSDMKDIKEDSEQPLQ